MHKSPSPAVAIGAEAQSLVARVRANIQNRKDHPSYGYRKTDARADMHRLEGLLYALAVLNHGERSANFVLQATEQADRMGIDLRDLYRRINAS